MKNILLVFDGLHFSEGALNFAKKVNDMEPVLVTGAFLPQVDYANLWSFSGGGSSGKSFIPMLEDADAVQVKKNIERFEMFCLKHGINYSVHKKYFDFALPELKKETRFADLLIIGGESFYDQAGTNYPNDYLQEALHGVECPVLIVPEQFEFPEMNILSYDGSSSSVFAIKQFAHLFPELTKNQTLLVSAQHSNEKMPEEEKILELTIRHFNKLVNIKLEKDSRSFFTNWMNQKKGAILVCGAFGRSDLSRIFKKSFVADIIGSHRIPVFVAHK